MSAADGYHVPTDKHDPILEPSPRPHPTSGRNGWSCKCGQPVLHEGNCTP